MNLKRFLSLMFVDVKLVCILIDQYPPVEAGAGAGQGEELPGDGGVGDGHDQGGEDQDYGQHVQLETLPVGLKCEIEEKMG